jgi:hypothetical protein
VINPKEHHKLSIVYGCADKCYGKSLNNMLYQGFDITDNLSNVLMLFQKEPFTLASDIEEMFTEVRVPDSDRGAHRVLWWPNRDLTAKPIEYQVTAHPLGATSAIFCAKFALRRKAERRLNAVPSRQLMADFLPVKIQSGWDPFSDVRIDSELQSSEDGLVRTIVVRTSKGNIWRDIRNICLFEEDQ